MTYEEFELDLIKIAWTCASSLEEVEEYTSIGRQCLWETLGTYSPGRSSFRTYLDRCVRNRIKDHKANQALHHRGHFAMDDPSIREELRTAWENDRWNPERLLIVNEGLAGLSSEAKEAVLLILRSPEEILSQAKNLSPKSLRGQVIRTLRERGWKWDSIFSTMREIKYAVANL